MVRSFVAVLMEPAVLDELQAVQKLLQKRLRPGLIRWARADQMHLTLRFLGDLPVTMVGRAASALRGACAGHQALSLTLKGLGAFPDVQRPRVLWAGLDGAVAALERLQADVATALRGFGDHHEERAFHPHLTLGRVPPRTRPGSSVAEALAAVESLQPVGWWVREVELMGSELRAEGARHTVLASVTLEQPGAGALVDPAQLRG